MAENNETENSNYTPIEIMHYTLLWCYNWREEDFRKAFKNSHLGWNYFWDKLQGKCKDEDNPSNPTSAIVAIILNMDKKHQQMLYDYIFNEKYREDIISQREWQKEILEIEKNAKEN